MDVAGPTRDHSSALAGGEVGERAAQTGDGVALDPLRRAISDLDTWLRHSKGVVEFSNRPDCILRIAVIPAEERLILSDGAVIVRGAPVVALHFWNEHLSQVDGQGIGWGAAIHRRLIRSFRELARAMQADPSLRGAKAVSADMASSLRHDPAAMDRFVARFGFEAVADGAEANWGQHLRDLAEDLWLFGLTWTFRPRALAHQRLLRRHNNLWTSRARFIARFGSG